MSSEPPFVTVIMPVYNEEMFIRTALKSVLDQDYPADRVEVLVVDGGSHDRTPQIVQALAEDDSRVRLLHNPGRIQAQGLNIGLDAARGDVIVRMDGHTHIAVDYVSRCVHHLQATGADYVGGPLRFKGITPVGQAIASAFRSPFCVPSRYRVKHTPGYVDMVYLGAWPRDVFDRVGHFNPALAINEDYELSYRIRKAGGRVYLAPDIHSHYYGRQSLAALWRQFFRYGRWKLRMLAQHPASVRPRQLAAPAFVATLIGGALLAPVSRRIARLWGLALLSYAIANLAASIQRASRDGWRLLFRLPLVFACVHLAWGSGFLVEILARHNKQGAHHPERAVH
ncbi:MAG: glycosyltransferase family 2 protein [Chloroflexi bacterium]|nr:glycosyltransferase family 2 protein [Chloroflexota bacterium]